jgi:hypothetical protein
MTFRRAVFSLILFGISFGFVEASIVVYLRHIYDPIRQEMYPDKPPGELLPLITPEQFKTKGPVHQRLLATELAREFATLVMLGTAALAVAANFRQWMGAFVLAFGVWDLFFYLFLKVIIDWPASLFTWDILFLLPLPWVGPVLSPCIVAAGMVFSGIVVLRRELAGPGIQIHPLHWAGIVLGGLVLMIAFMWDWRNTVGGNPPNPFNWPLFIAGMAAGMGSFAHAAWGGKGKLAQ